MVFEIKSLKLNLKFCYLTVRNNLITFIHIFWGFITIFFPQQGNILAELKWITWGQEQLLSCDHLLLKITKKHKSNLEFPTEGLSKTCFTFPDISVVSNIKPIHLRTGCLFVARTKRTVPEFWYFFFFFPFFFGFSTCQNKQTNENSNFNHKALSSPDELAWAECHHVTWRGRSLL